jgi:hypothetical protein
MGDKYYKEAKKSAMKKEAEELGIHMKNSKSVKRRKSARWKVWIPQNTRRKSNYCERIPSRRFQSSFLDHPLSRAINLSNLAANARHSLLKKENSRRKATTNDESSSS